MCMFFLSLQSHNTPFCSISLLTSHFLCITYMCISENVSTMSILLTGINRFSGFSFFCEEESFDETVLGIGMGLARPQLILSWPCGWRRGHAGHLGEDPADQGGSDNFLLTFWEAFFLSSFWTWPAIFFSLLFWNRKKISYGYKY